MFIGPMYSESELQRKMEVESKFQKGALEGSDNQLDLSKPEENIIKP
jgi:hypothetical protein